MLSLHTKKRTEACLPLDNITFYLNFTNFCSFASGFDFAHSWCIQDLSCLTVRGRRCLNLLFMMHIHFQYSIQFNFICTRLSQSSFTKDPGLRPLRVSLGQQWQGNNRRQMWTAGRPVKHTHSMPTKPRCCNSCRMRPGIALLK